MAFFVDSVAAEGAMRGARATLICRAGGQRYALPIAHVVETMRPLPVTTVAGVPAAVLGLAIIRGAPTPVVDLAGVVGAVDAAPAGRFVVLTAGGRRVALAVSEVLGVYSLDDAAFGALPPLLRGAVAGAVDSVGTLDGELLAFIDGARLVPPSVWDAVGAARL